MRVPWDPLCTLRAHFRRRRRVRALERVGQTIKEARFVQAMATAEACHFARNHGCRVIHSTIESGAYKLAPIWLLSTHYFPSSFAPLLAYDAPGDGWPVDSAQSFVIQSVNLRRRCAVRTTVVGVGREQRSRLSARLRLKGGDGNFSARKPVFSHVS